MAEEREQCFQRRSGGKHPSGSQELRSNAGPSCVDVLGEAASIGTFSLPTKVPPQLDMLAHTCKSCMQETETRGLRIPKQVGLHSKALLRRESWNGEGRSHGCSTNNLSF